MHLTQFSIKLNTTVLSVNRCFLPLHVYLVNVNNTFTFTRMVTSQYVNANGIVTYSRMTKHLLDGYVKAI